MKNKNIIVNASAIRTGGALTILKQFIYELPSDENIYYIFVHKSFEINNERMNLKLIYVEKTSFLKRFLWDLYGVKFWLKKNRVFPNITISLQNTNFLVGVDCPNYVYYHQSIPLFPFNWKFFNKNERIFWIYKNIYPIFVKLFINRKTQFFVQLNCIRDQFTNVFNIQKERIHVVFPNIHKPKFEFSKQQTKLNSDNLNLFYPAASYPYKNHEIVFKSLEIIDNKLDRKIDLYLTNTKSEFKFNYIFKNIEIKYIGNISHEDVYSFYDNVDCLLFPSFIETFGLPLIEAATCGLKIIASDLPYAREVLQGYKGVNYAKFDNAEDWANCILQVNKMHKATKYKNFILTEHASWADFFNIIKQDNNV